MTTTRRACFNAIASAALLLGAAQAHAMTFSFNQAFNGGGFVGIVSGTFSAVDTGRPSNPLLPDGIFQSSEMTFLTLAYTGTAPTLGAVNLAYTPPNIGIAGTTEWFANDKTLGDAFNGFFLSGASAAGTQMTWVAGPVHFFDYGNTPGTNTGGDPQNGNPGCPSGPVCKFGQIDLFTSANAGGDPLATATSFTYATIEVSAVPEPSTYLMMLGGFAALALRARKTAH